MTALVLLSLLVVVSLASAPPAAAGPASSSSTTSGGDPVFRPTGLRDAGRGVHPRGAAVPRGVAAPDSAVPGVPDPHLSLALTFGTLAGSELGGGSAAGRLPTRWSVTPGGGAGAFAPGSSGYYPAEGIRTPSGLYLPARTAWMYGMRRDVLGRGRTALKGAGGPATFGLVAGAFATSFGWIDEKTAFWLAGGAAALGAFYGATWGYEDRTWREEWRWPEERDESRSGLPGR